MWSSAPVAASGWHLAEQLHKFFESLERKLSGHLVCIKYLFPAVGQGTKAHIEKFESGSFLLIWIPKAVATVESLAPLRLLLLGQKSLTMLLIYCLKLSMLLQYPLASPLIETPRSVVPEAPRWQLL